MNTWKDCLFLVPKGKPKEQIPLSMQFYQIQQQAQQWAIEETAPLHATIQSNNIELQDDLLLQPCLSTPTPETPQFQQVPIFEYDNIDNTVSDEKLLEQTNESLIVQDDHSSALVPHNVSNTLAYHQLQRETVTMYNKFSPV